MPRIDLNRVATFVRVGETGSFTAAARSLRLPTSSISRAVANLEGELGVRLINRSTRKLSLTDAGDQFFQRMQAILGEADEATEAVSGFSREPRGVVRLTAPVDLGLHVLPPLVAGLTARHPGLVMELVLTSRRMDLIDEGIDLALRGGRLEESSLVARKIMDSGLGVFASPAYLARRDPPRTVADLARHPCLRYGGRGGDRPWRLTGPRGEEAVAVSGPVVCDDMLFLREMVLAGVGLALLPIGNVAADVAAKRLVRVLPRHSLGGAGLYLLWPSRRLVPARVAAVRDFLIDALSPAKRR
jgi:DNA-binding transcriptional LysR family regulator